MCITTHQPHTKPNPNPNPTTEQHAVVNIQLNIIICPMHPDKFTRHMLLYHLYQLRLPQQTVECIQRSEYDVLTGGKSGQLC